MTAGSTRMTACNGFESGSDEARTFEALQSVMELAEILTLYLPGVNDEIRNAPCPSVTVTRELPSAPVTVTTAPSIGAPDLSVTSP